MAAEIQVRNGIHTGWACEQEPFEKMYERCTGNARTFDPRVFKLAPCGSRILLVREEEVTKVGHVIIPDTTALKNPPGAGYIIAVGDMVGAGTSPHPHGVRCDNPAELLYKRIIFGMFSGAEFHTQSYKDGGFATAYWLLTDRDVWFVDWGVEE